MKSVNGGIKAKNMKFFSVLVFILFLTTRVDACRILAYFPTPSISHQLPFRPLTQELVKRGHEVVVITPDPAFPKGEAPAKLTEIDVHDISYDLMTKLFLSRPRGTKDSFMRIMEDAIALFSPLIDAQLTMTEVQNAIYGQKYDLLLLEACARPLLGLSYVHKVPIILISSRGVFWGNSEAMGIPTHPMLYPLPSRQGLYNLSVWEKIQELYNHYKIIYLFNKYEKSENRMLQKHFGNTVSTLSELYSNVDMLFLNMHPIFEGNFPVPPGVVYMWGIHKKPQKELPEDLKTFLDSSNHGVIYMSFGTNTDPTSLPPEKIQIFVKVFCQLPYNVLWKWNKDVLPGRCKNIKIDKWFPQSDLLRHPKIKLFVTQGGLQSTDEAIRAGVPLVGIPMLGDQWYNVQKYVHFKIGIQLDLEAINENKFQEAVTTVINDESYRQNIQKLDALMRDEPMGALERAVWWVEYTLRHGGAKHLRAPAHNISSWQYFEMDFVLILLGGLVTSLTMILVILYYLYSIIRRKIVGFSSKRKRS